MGTLLRCQKSIGKAQGIHPMKTNSCRVILAVIEISDKKKTSTSITKKKLV